MGKSTKLRQEKALAYEEQLASRLAEHNQKYKKTVRQKGGHWHEFLPGWARKFPMVKACNTFVAKSFNRERNIREILKHCFEQYKIPHSLFSAMLEKTEDEAYNVAAHIAANEGRAYNFRQRRLVRDLDKFLSWGVNLGAGRSLYKTFGKDEGLTKAECHWFTNHPNTINDVYEALRWAMCKARNVENAKTISAIVYSKNNWYNASWIDFFVRNEVESVETVNDLLDFLNAHRNIDLAGRTIASVTNLMNDWHMTLALMKQKETEWIGVDIADWEFNDEGHKRLQIVAKQLCDTKSLVKEGRQMHHCVGGYVNYCQTGRSAIWSITAQDKEHEFERVTIEMSLPSQKLVQVRGPWNKLPSKFMQKCVDYWKLKGTNRPKYIKEDEISLDN